MSVNRSAPGGDIVPYRIYHDVAKAMDWLCDVFGFTERLRVTGADGKVGHGPRKGQGFASAPDSAELRPPRPNEVTQSLSVHVEDVLRHYERARQRGARILGPPTTCRFGERQYTAEDLDGHRWTFSQSVADVKPEEWGATVSAAIDVLEAAAFYEKVFGWNILRRESHRPSLDDATGYASGAFVSTGVTGREMAGSPGLLPCIWVDGVDGILALVAASGGEAVDAPRSEGASSWIATFHDPSGNLIGLYQEGPR
jgi:uncharacterized glyoxalase superfamily protein PhnB